MKKIIAILLAIILCASCALVPVGAASALSADNVQQTIENNFNTILEKVLFLLLDVLNKLIPGLDWTGAWSKADDYETGAFYAGKESFDTAARDDAAWSVGYAQKSLLDGLDVFNGTFFMAGSLEAFEGRVPSEVLDDQRVRTFAISDGSDTLVYAAIDGFGLGRKDVQIIRERLSGFATAKGIGSINVSALHQHSCIDTLGMNVPLVPALLTNPGALLLQLDEDKIIKKNSEFMENLYTQVTLSVMEAVNSMETGTLYYGSANIDELIRDKREPEVYDEEISRLRFVPDDVTQNEIWICEAGIHPVDLGAGTSLLSGDFPYYLAETVQKTTGADVAFIQGAELALTTDTSALTPADDSDLAKISAYAEALAEGLYGIDNEQALAPLLNFAHTEVFLPVENGILTLASREDLLASVIVRKGLGYEIVTEMGYMELGSSDGFTLGIAFIPGEIAPEILWGGAISAEESWTGESWQYAPLATVCGADRLLCFGLCNDQVGYILTDNDYRCIFTENEEINATSNSVGSVLTHAFGNLIAAIK